MGTRAAAPLGRDLAALIAAASQAPNGNGSGNGTGNGNGSRHGGTGGVGKAEARRIAIKFGGAMLAAASIETARHSDDVVIISRALCDQLGIRGTERQDLLAAARLHDIGKVAIPSDVLTKPGPLSATEWRRMRQHTVVGHRILRSVPELEGIATIVRHSHERWDGAGYPDGLAGERIPLGSRVILCADAFHAIRSDRPYRPGRPAADALAEVKRGAGTQFDPQVVEAFEHVVRDLRLAPVPARIRPSKRLVALLMMLVIGAAGTAVARTGLLGELPGGGSGEDAAAGTEPPAAIGCADGRCGSLLGTSLNEIFGGEDSFDRPPGGHLGYFVPGAAPGHSTSGSPASPLEGGVQQGPAPADTPSASTDSFPITSGAIKTPSSGAEEGFGSDAQQVQQGGPVGSGPSTPPPTSPGKPGKGNGWGHGHGSHGSGGPGSGAQGGHGGGRGGRGPGGDRPAGGGSGGSGSSGSSQGGGNTGSSGSGPRGPGGKGGLGGPGSPGSGGKGGWSGGPGPSGPGGSSGAGPRGSGGGKGGRH